jgi:hypothetical protein
MLCSKCGVENRQAARFCGSCGSTLQPQCVACGALNRPGPPRIGSPALARVICVINLNGANGNVAD